MTLFICIIFFVCIVWGYLRMEYRYPHNIDCYLRLLVVLLLIVAAGFRDGLSGYADYQNYVWAFQSKDEEIFEYSFVLISYIARWIGGDNYYYLFLIYALLGVSLKYMAIKQLTPLVWLSLAIYISYFYSLHELTQIRAGVAAGIGLLSLRFVYEKRFIPFILLILLATFFHTSALLYLPLYLLDGKRIQWKYWGIGCVIFLFLYQFLADKILIYLLKFSPAGLIQNKIVNYAERGIQGLDSTSFSSNMALFSYLLLGIFILFANRMQLYNKYFHLLLKVYILGFAIKIIFSPVVPEIGNRGYEMLSVTSIILIPMLAYIVKPRIIGILLVFVVGVVYLYYILFSWQIIP